MKDSLKEFKVVKGDGVSIVKLESSSGRGTVEYNIEELEELSGIERLEIGVGVKVVVSSRKGLELLGNIGMIGGDGQLEYKDLLDDAGEVELTALEFARIGKEGFTEDFVNNEQVIIESSQEDFVDVFSKKIVNYVFVLREDERVVDIGDFTLTAAKNNRSIGVGCRL